MSRRQAACGRLKSLRFATSESVRQQDAGLVGITSVIQPDVPDALHDFSTGGACEFAENAIALRAVADPGADLYEFVVVQGTAEFGNDVRPRATLADQNDRLAVVSKSSQVFLLCFVEGHRRHPQGVGSPGDPAVVGSIG